MTRLWFVVPVHRREQLTAVCLRQLARTCEALASGIKPRFNSMPGHEQFDATAVVVGDDRRTLQLADTLGFATVRRNNQLLGRKFNDGFQLAADPRYNSEPADYVIPCGSDDWIDPQTLSVLPGQERIGYFRRLAAVDPTRTWLAELRVWYQGGCGIRIYPARLLETVGYRPAQEDVNVGVDGSILHRLRRWHRWSQPPLVCLDKHPLQIVDWKSGRDQLHTYNSLRVWRQGDQHPDPLGRLADIYPDAVDEIGIVDAPSAAWGKLQTSASIVVGVENADGAPRKGRSVIQNGSRPNTRYHNGSVKGLTAPLSVRKPRPLSGAMASARAGMVAAG